ncbi:ATP-binding protein [Ancylobacter sp. FA202]|uniref:ATP-binding protein n=1 Tax=Ancylobacter sp. FA202 TaxID=1111106 RepID=UPI00036562ED|nr:ATP-binding protein [Ancylobacter sp. FA202]
MTPARNAAKIAAGITGNTPSAPGGPSRPASFGWWQRHSLRAQVLTAVVAINLCAALLAVVVIIANARRATEAEMLSSLAVAERFVQETVERLASAEGATGSLAQLPLHISGLRHVRIRIEDQAGNALDIAPAEADEEEHEGDVPGWFTRLVSVEGQESLIPIVENGARVGQVRVAGEASDEIAEVWEDMSDLAVLAAAVNIAILVALYLVLGRLLMPLRTLSAGLHELEAGRFEHRLATPRVRELALIADRFNALGAALKAARGDNARLNERLVSVQDDERRQIASDLHDELGPCVFGLRANLESIERLTARAEPALGQRMGERIATMADILNRIQCLNRRLLRKIRPMALGHVPLAAVLADLVADFESHSPGRRITLATEGLAERYGDSVDITLYRCIQEAVTNALRHGDARNIAISLRADRRAGRIDLTIEDDGTGIADDAPHGFGLIGMEERIGALGGKWSIVAAVPSGTRIDVAIPAHPTEFGLSAAPERLAAQ